MFYKILSWEEATTPKTTPNATSANQNKLKISHQQKNRRLKSRIPNTSYLISVTRNGNIIYPFLWLHNVVDFGNPVFLIENYSSSCQFFSSSKELFWDGKAVDCN